MLLTSSKQRPSFVSDSNMFNKSPINFLPWVRLAPGSVMVGGKKQPTAKDVEYIVSLRTAKRYD